jgi:hypothetical protein
MATAMEVFADSSELTALLEGGRADLRIFFIVLHRRSKLRYVYLR